MITTRREVIAGGLAAVAAAAGGVPVWAAEEASAYFAGTAADNSVIYRTTNFRTRSTRSGRSRWSNISVRSHKARWWSIRVNHMLYLVMENRTAIRYGVGVGREGRFKWYGHATIDDKALWPKWTPPPEMLERRPELPPFIAGGASDNPLGARAMYLHRDGVDTGYRLHGTVEPWNVGTELFLRVAAFA